MTDGIDGVRIGGKPVKLAFGCTNGTTASTLAEARRLVEQVGVRILIGPTGGEEGLALQDYERRQPAIAFVNGSASAQQLDPPSNYFSFHADGAETMAGLAAYAYHELGWRRAVTVAEAQDNLFNWTQTAGFIAEFCSLGGTIPKRIWVPSGTEDYTNVDRPDPGRRGGRLRPRERAEDRGRAGARISRAEGEPRGEGDHRPDRARSGLVCSASGSRVSLGARALPDPPRRVRGRPPRALPPTHLPYAFDLYYHDAMTATLQALDHVGGDLSNDERRFMAALATLPLDTPIGRIRLDASHEAVGPNGIFRARTQDEGSTVRRVDGVEHTFGGYFKPTDPPPTRTSPACVKRTPPPWAR